MLDPPSVREVGGESCEEVVRALVVDAAVHEIPPAVGTLSFGITLRQ